MQTISKALNRVRPGIPYDGIVGALYDYGVEHERLGRVAGWLMWRMDTRPMYKSMACVADVEDGSTVLDIPCGGGVIFRYLSPKQDVRYLAADIATEMLARAQREADKRQLKQIEFVEASVEDLPFEDASIDLCVCFNGLHCFPDPETAIAEMARCLRPDGRLVGATVVRDRGMLNNLFLKFLQAAGPFGPGGSQVDYKRRFKDAGLKDLQLKFTGAEMIFEARKSADATA